MPEVTEEVRDQIIQMLVRNKRMNMRLAAERVGVAWRDVQRVVEEWKASRVPEDAEARAIDPADRDAGAWIKIWTVMARDIESLSRSEGFRDLVATSPQRGNVIATLTQLGSVCGRCADDLEAHYPADADQHGAT